MWKVEMWNIQYKDNVIWNHMFMCSLCPLAVPDKTVKAVTVYLTVILCVTSTEVVEVHKVSTQVSKSTSAVLALKSATLQVEVQPQILYSS